MAEQKKEKRERDLKLSHRFGVIVGVFVLGFLLVGGWGLRTLNELKVNGPIYQRIVQGKDLVADILPPPNYIIESYLNVIEAQGKTNKAELESLAARIEALRKEYFTRHEHWQKEGLEPELHKAFLDAAHAPVGRFYEAVQKSYFPALVVGDRAAAEKSLEDIRTLYEQHRGAIDKVVKLANARNEASEKSAAGTIQSDLIIMGMLYLAALVIGIGIAAVFARRVIRQIGGEPSFAAKIARRVSEGDFSHDIPVTANDHASVLAGMAKMQNVLRDIVAAQIEMAERHDAGEISYRIDASKYAGAYGDLTQKLNHLVASHIAVEMRIVEVVSRYAQGDLSMDMDRLPGEKAKITEAVDGVKASLGAVNSEIGKLVQAAAHGDFSVRGDEANFDHDFRKMVAGLNQLMHTSDQGLAEVSRVLGALAQGDLTEKISNDYQGTFGKLKDDCNQTVENLTTIVNQIKDASVTIDTAAKEISQGNTDLSSRTEEQASSLEETASSMEELTSTVKQNAENARQANQLAVGASDVAVKGGDVVKQVVSTMSGISASSKKIADIIGTIDGIAFQTNILALNAAVEAARAGEQGRGFAVVATEVRNLAQRSANAAKEIKQLIEDSVNRVDAGNKLVSEAGSTMDEIVTSVKRVTDIMAEITAASQEQSSGIEQVNQAITQMDEVTQQNAALVEQAAAAAESMQEQAGALVQAVGTFKVEQAEGAAERAFDKAQDRRGPNRATNVARLSTLAAKPAKAERKPAANTPVLKKAVGADDDWQEF